MCSSWHVMMTLHALRCHELEGDGALPPPSTDAACDGAGDA